MREYCLSTKCLRKSLNSHFSLNDNAKPSDNVSELCSCCYICSSQCTCEKCFLPACDVDKSTASQTAVNSELAVRTLTDNQLDLLKLNLVDYQDLICEDDPENIQFFNDTLIDSIVSNSKNIVFTEDVMDLGLLKPDYAEDVLMLIEEIENL